MRVCDIAWMLELRGVVVEGRLDRCSFAARPGEVLGLVGATGSGKSTALAVGAGHLPVRRGRVLLDGRDARAGRLKAAVGLAGDGLEGPHDVEIAGWLRLWGELDGVPRAELAEGVGAVCDRFGLGELGRRVGTLSGGERRHLALARLWLRAPQVLLLDAPGDGLDGDGLRRLTTAVREAAADGRTVLIADAAPHLPTTLCDRAVCLAGGTVTAEVARADTDFGERVAASQGWAL